MIDDNLKNLVRQEADNIKRYATEKEIGSLDFSMLNPSRPELCIYGQMTGNCSNKRAKELLKNTATIGLLNDFAGEHPVTKTKHVLQRKIRYTDILALTAIEYYISLPYAKNAELIAYLKGENDTLDI